MAKKWTREEVVRVFELLIENGSPVISHPKFRQILDRDENLFTNQIIRESNNNIAYRSVDFDVEGMDDGDFWERIDKTPYNELIEDNAAAAIFKMVDKLGLLQ